MLNLPVYSKECCKSEFYGYLLPILQPFSLLLFVSQGQEWTFIAWYGPLKVTLSTLFGPPIMPLSTYSLPTRYVGIHIIACNNIRFCFLGYNLQ